MLFQSITPDPIKIEAITNLQPPRNASEVRSFLGMLNYLTKFPPNLAGQKQPFRELILKDTEWSWTAKHQHPFNHVKKQLSKAKSLSYHDMGDEIHLYVDAGPFGLGAIFAQEEGGETETIAYGSKSLTDTEQRYSQIEKEMLAVTWTMQHFHVYLFGVKFHRHIDHKPLVSILQNPKSSPSARMERLRLRIQQ